MKVTNNKGITDYINEYLTYIRYKNYSLHTIRQYQPKLIYFNAFLIQKHKHIRIQDISRDTIREFLTIIYQRGYSDNTRALYVFVLKGYFKFLARNDYLKINPMFSISAPRRTKRLPNFLSEGEMIKLLEAPATKTYIGLRDRAILEILYSTGMRVAELVGLNYEDIDFKKQTILIRGKGMKERIGDINRNTAEALLDYLCKAKSKKSFLYTREAIQNHLNKLKPRRKDEALFLNKYGGRLTTRSIGVIVKYYAQKAGIKSNVSPHTIRHSIATHFLNAGVGLREIQEFLGHSNISTTQIYTHISIEKLFQEHNKLFGKAEPITTPIKPVYFLNSREKKIIELHKKKKSQRQIAKELGIQQSGVSRIWNSIPKEERARAG